MPTEPPSALPWPALLTTDQIPWQVMERFADALAEDPGLWPSLKRLYLDSLDRSADEEVYEYVYVLGIVAMGAPRLPDEHRRKIGGFLLGELIAAAEDNDDVLSDLLTAAAGALGPPIVPLVLDAIKDQFNERKGGWFHLWSLAALAADTDDATVRRRAGRLAYDVLRRADYGRLDLADASAAARLVARLKHTPARGVVERLASKPPEFVFDRPFFGDICEALAQLDGTAEVEPLPKPWEEPVRKWLESPWTLIRNRWAEGGPNRTGDEDEDRADTDAWDEADDVEDIDAALARAQEIAGRFAESPAARDLPGEVREDAPAASAYILEYAANYMGRGPEELDEPTLREILLEIFPRKVLADRDFFEHAAPAAQAFLRWLGTQGMLEAGAARGLAEAVGQWGDQIVKHAMDRSRWGMAKSLLTLAQKQGYDPTDQADLNRFMQAYNARLVLDEPAEEAKPPTADTEPAGGYGLPDQPTRNPSRKVGRNDPCPCGSGKKYKKCCGRR